MTYYDYESDLRLSTIYLSRLKEAEAGMLIMKY